MTPSEGLQAVLLDAHHMLNGPWWATLVGVTLAFRTSLLPLVVVQLRGTHKMFSGKCGAQMRHLTMLVRKEVDEGGAKSSWSKSRRVLKLYWTGLRGIWRANRVNPAAPVLVPLAQIPVFVSFVFAMRRLVADGSWGLAEGGALWFPDLSVADPYLVLPFTAVGLTYTSLQLGFMRGGPSPSPPQQQPQRTNHAGGPPSTPTPTPTPTPFIARVGGALQMVVLVSSPMIAQLPSGVFMYWIPSSLFGIAQTLALRNPSVRAALLEGPQSTLPAPRKAVPGSKRTSNLDPHDPDAASRKL